MPLALTRSRLSGRHEVQDLAKLITVQMEKAREVS